MIIEITAAAIGGGMVGFFACAAMTAGKVADLQSQIAHTYRESLTFCRAIYSVHFREGAPDWQPLGTLNGIMSQLDNMIAGLGMRLTETQDAHARATDALTTKQARIDRALEQITPGANATVKRIARILKGEAA